MHSIQPPTGDSRDVQNAVERILREHLADSGLREVDVRAGQDHDGDDILYVDAYFDLQSEVHPERFHGLTTAVRGALEPLGEFRFPHLRYHFPEGQEVAGWS